MSNTLEKRSASALEPGLRVLVRIYKGLLDGSITITIGNGYAVLEGTIDKQHFRHPFKLPSMNKLTSKTEDE